MLGKAMANYPQELAQDAAYQSHTGHLTGLWFLPKLTQGLNTNNNKNNNLVSFKTCLHGVSCLEDAFIWSP